MLDIKGIKERLESDSDLPSSASEDIKALLEEVERLRKTLERVRDETSPYPGIRLITTIARVALGEISEVDVYPVSDRNGKPCSGETDGAA